MDRGIEWNVFDWLRMLRRRIDYHTTTKVIYYHHLDEAFPRASLQGYDVIRIGVRELR